MRFLFASLRSRLMLLAIIAVIPMFGLVIYDASREREQQMTAVQDNALRFAQFVTNEHQQLVEGTRQLLIALAQLPAIRERDSAACSLHLANLLKQFPQYANLVVAGLNGDIFCSAVPNSSTVNIRDRGYFQRAINSRGFSIGEYQIGRITRAANIGFGYPILDSADEPQGVIFAALNLDYFNQIASTATLPDGATLTVVDGNGTILSRFPDPALWVGKTLPEKAIIQAMLNQPKGTADLVGLDGNSRLYGFTRITSDRVTGALFASVGLPKQAAFADVDERLTRDLIRLIGVAAFALLVALVYSRWFILRRVNVLVDTAQRLQAGDLTARTGLLYGGSELSELSRAFDHMANALEQRQAAREHAEQELAQSASELQTVFQALPDLYFRLAPDGAIVDYLAGQSNDLRTMPHVFEGQRIQNIFPSEVGREFERALEQVRQSGSMIAIEYSLPMPNGEQIFEARLLPLMPDQVVAVIRDITERKRAEEAEREQRIFAEALRDSAAALNSTLDFDTVLDRILDNVGRVVPHDTATIMLIEAGIARTARCRGFTERGLGEWIFKIKFCVDEVENLRRIMQTREPVIIADTLQAAGWVRFPETSWIRSHITAPIYVQGAIIGFLNLDNVIPDFFTPTHAARLEVFAHQAAIALQNARLHDELQTSLAMSTRLYQLSSQILTATTFEETARLLTETVYEGFGADSVSIRLFDPQGNLQFEHGTGLGPDVYRESRPRPDGLTLQAWRSGKTLITNDPERIHPRLRAEGMQANIALPLRGELHNLGVLFLDYRRPRHFTEREQKLLSLFANQAALAMERVRLLEDKHHRIAELEAVNRVSTALRAAQTLDEMLPILLDEMLAVIGADAGRILLYDPVHDFLRPMVARGWLVDIGMQPVRSGGIAAHVLATGAVYLSREFKSDPLTGARARGLMPPGVGGGCIPIRSAQEVIGAFFVSFSAPRELNAAETRLLTTLAEIAGNAIHRIRLHGQTEQRLQQLMALREVDQAITASLDLPIVLNVILDQTMSQLRVDAARVLQLDLVMQTFETGAVRGFRSHSRPQARLPLSQTYAGRAVLERRTICIPNIQVEGSAARSATMAAGEGFVSYYGVPLIAKGKVKGVLEIFHRSQLETDPEWQDYLGTLARQAAIAIDSGELFERLQRSNAELALAYDTTLEGWSRALDLRDEDTEGHTQRVAELTVRLAQAVGIGGPELVHIRYGALLHDIGKMGIPDRILLKPGPLSPEEWEVMRQHPVYAYQLLLPIPYLRPALDIPYCHHEKWDGTGYPRGLKSEQIPLAARLFAVVDVWDALCSNRPYRSAWSDEQVRAHIRANSGSHFDPQVVEVFFKLKAKSD